jgi:ABC-type sugar transport system permease subunit
MKPSKRMIIMFLTPALLAYAFIFLYPTLRTIYMSFFEVSGFVGMDMHYRGIANYRELYHTRLFRDSFVNIFRVWMIGGGVVFAAAFLFTVLLTSGIRGKKFFRAIIYLPNLIPVVAMATMWTQYIYNRRYGFFTHFFQALGMEGMAKTQWTSFDMIFWSMLIAYIWGSIGWYMLILLAGVERIPNDYYEAAKLDGANLFQMFYKITLPLLRDVLRVALIMWSITVINLFAFPRAFTPVNLPKELMTPANYLYQLAFGMGSGGGGSSGLQVGKAAAIAVCLLGMVLLVSEVINRLLKPQALEY